VAAAAFGEISAVLYIYTGFSAACSTIPGRVVRHTIAFTYGELSVDRAAGSWSGAYLLFALVYGPFILRPSLEK
jgi:uncharacterized protein involved in response to NO